MISNIETDLSIIIQGPISKFTYQLIEYITNELAQCEVILSTWDNQDLSLVNNNNIKVIKSKDPGGYFSELGEHLNVNRQIVSSLAGIKLSKRKYVLKIRSDILIDVNKTLKLYSQYNSETLNGLFNEKLLVLNLTSVNPKRRKRLYAFNDWIYLGLRSDLLKLFSCPLYPKKYVNYFSDNLKTNLRYNAEQWIFINSIFKDNLLKKFSHGFIFNDNLLAVHNSFLKELIILNPFQINLKSSKYSIFRFGLNDMYTHKEWAKIALNKKYIYDFERCLYSLAYFKPLRNFLKWI